MGESIGFPQPSVPSVDLQIPSPCYRVPSGSASLAACMFHSLNAASPNIARNCASAFAFAAGHTFPTSREGVPGRATASVTSRWNSRAMPSFAVAIAGGRALSLSSSAAGRWTPASSSKVKPPRASPREMGRDCVIAGSSWGAGADPVEARLSVAVRDVAAAAAGLVPASGGGAAASVGGADVRLEALGVRRFSGSSVAAIAVRSGVDAAVAPVSGGIRVGTNADDLSSPAL